MIKREPPQKEKYNKSNKYCI